MVIEERGTAEPDVWPTIKGRAFDSFVASGCGIAVVPVEGLTTRVAAFLRGCVAYTKEPYIALFFAAGTGAVATF
jgi:hypothetical protein